MVVKYLRENKGALSGQLEEVTCGMWGACANAAAEVFGDKVRVTIGRFHAMKNFPEQLTEARREAQRGLAKEEAKGLKGARWLWQASPENLAGEQRQGLERLKERSPKWKELVERRESLRAIFEDTTIKGAAVGEEKLRGWMRQAQALGLKGLLTFGKTLGNWMGKIANYFVWRSSNGRTEGFSRGLRAILWRAFGMANFRNFRLRVLDRFGSPRKA